MAISTIFAFRRQLYTGAPRPFIVALAYPVTRFLHLHHGVVLGKMFLTKTKRKAQARAGVGFIARETGLPSTQSQAVVSG